MTSVHQLLPTISPRDAVGNHTLALQGVLRGLGFESEIFSMFRHPDLMTKTHYVDQLPPDADAVIYQLSIGSPVADRWARHPGKKIANYPYFPRRQMGWLTSGGSATRARPDG